MSVTSLSTSIFIPTPRTAYLTKHHLKKLPDHPFKEPLMAFADEERPTPLPVNVSLMCLCCSVCVSEQPFVRWLIFNCDVSKVQLMVQSGM